jgi:hypothetical protein
MIGGACEGVGATFSGRLDEVTFVGNVLSSDEIRAIYDAGYSGACLVNPFRSRADFDGDGRTDVSVFRPNEGNWYLSQSTAGFAVIKWGLSGDTLVPGDYDGDGKTDTAVFRSDADPANPDFYVLNSNGFIISGTSWGVPGDLPIVGDYDGDGKTDMAVFRPSNAVWYIINSGGSPANTIAQFGLNGDTPLAIDNDGDGKTNLAVFRPGTGYWYMAKPVGVPAQDFIAIPFGLPTDKLVPADYDGDSKEDVAVFRPSNGTWYIHGSSDGIVQFIPFGTTGDFPAPGDYDGDGKDDVAIFRPSSGQWWLSRSTAGIAVQAFGVSNDKPIPASYIPQ